MVKIRLSRFGKKNDPFYKVIAIDERKKREGMSLAVFGTYHPREKKINIDKKLVEEWVKKGAQVSPTVMALMK